MKDERVDKSFYICSNRCAYTGPVPLAATFDGVVLVGQAEQSEEPVSVEDSENLRPGDVIYINGRGNYQITEIQPT